MGADEGIRVGQVLQRTLNARSGELSRLRSELTANEGLIRALASRRGEALLRLAKHDIPEMSRAAIESTYSEVRSELLRILDRKEDRREQLITGIDGAEAELVERERELDSVTSDLNQKVAERDRLEEEVETRLATYKNFAELSKEVATADEELARNEERVEELAREAKDKLPPYEKSSLFMYLFKRKYGRSDYTSRGLIRTLDGWVAKLIDYRRARKGYEFLKTTPELVAAEVERRREERGILFEKLEALEDEIAEATGLTRVLAEGERLGARHDELVVARQAVVDRLSGMREELLGIEQSQGRYYGEALERYRKFLGDTETAVMESRARRTPDFEDDEIVREIRDVEGEIVTARGQLEDLDDHRDDIEERVRGLREVVGKYRRHDYDSRRSYFEGLDIDRELDRYLTGKVSSTKLWRKIREAQRFRPTYSQRRRGRIGRVRPGTGRSASRGGLGGGLAGSVGSELSRTLVRAITHAAGEALRSGMGGGFPRGGGSIFGSSRRRGGGRKSSPRRRSGGGGFTSGQGF